MSTLPLASIQATRQAGSFSPTVAPAPLPGTCQLPSFPVRHQVNLVSGAHTNGNQLAVRVTPFRYIQPLTTHSHPLSFLTPLQRALPSAISLAYVVTRSARIAGVVALHQPPFRSNFVSQKSRRLWLPVSPVFKLAQTAPPLPQ